MDLSFPERDQRLNESSTPPPEEHIDLRCVWGIEFYTPAYADRLESGLLQLGWGASGADGLKRDPIAWLRGLARRRYSGGWLNLGVLTTDHSPPFFMSHHVPTLPQSAEYAQAQISAISPSLVALTVCFAVREEFSDSIDDILREPRSSYTTPIPRGSRIHDPHSQKVEALEELRHTLRSDVADWFAEFVPGVLSSGDRHVPTWELVTANLGHPVVPGESERPPLWSYLEAIGFTLGLDSWAFGDPASLYLSTDQSRDHALLIGNTDTLEKTLRSGTENPRNRVVFEVNEQLLEIIPLWGLIPLVDQYTQDTINATVPGDGRPEQTLDVLTESMRRRTDLPFIASELVDLSEEEQGVWARADSFTRVRHSPSRPAEKLGEVLRFVSGNQGVWLKAADRAARDNLVQYGTLLASAENVRLQGRIKLLTYAVVGLAILTVLAQIAAATWW